MKLVITVIGKDRVGIIATVSNVLAENKVNIISISFGTNQYSEALKQAIDEANAKGILVIAAAGNQGESKKPAGEKGAVKTGDESPIMLSVICMAAAMGLGIVVLRKRKER